MSNLNIQKRLYQPLSGIFLLLFLSVSCGQNELAMAEPTPTPQEIATAPSTPIQQEIAAEASTAVPTEPATGFINGMVVAANNLSPIAGANISTDPPSGVILTDSEGKYQLSNVLPGNYAVIAMKAGFQSSNAQVVVIGGQTTQADISLAMIPSATPKPTKMATATAVFTPTSTPIPPESTPSIEKTITVAASANWVNSGLLIEPGNQVDIVYLSGLWTSGGINALHDANGTALNYICNIEYPDSICLEPIPGAVKGALIARIGNGNPFLIGNGAIFTATTRGPLMLSMNDSVEANDLIDNQGSIVVSIRVTNMSLDQGIIIPQPLNCTTPSTAGPYTLLLLPFDNSYNGTAEEPVGNSGAMFTTGIFGQAIDFDANDGLAYATTDNLNLEHGSITFWLRPNWDGNDELNHTFFEVGSEWFNRMRIMKDGANNLRFILWDSDEESGIGYSVDHWHAGEWHQIAVSWERSGKIALFVDCTQVASSESAQLPTIVAGPIFIGLASWEGQYANAVIDDFHISNAPLIGESN